MTSVLVSPSWGGSGLGLKVGLGLGEFRVPLQVRVVCRVRVEE